MVLVLVFSARLSVPGLVEGPCKRKGKAQSFLVYAFREFVQVTDGYDPLWIQEASAADAMLYLDLLFVSLALAAVIACAWEVVASWSCCICSSCSVEL